MRDVTANRHETSGGMRWTQSVREMMRIEADGEVVWSWSPDAGIKSVDMRFRPYGRNADITGDGG
jgi:hypothetical protein